MTCFGVAPLRSERGIAASAISATVIGFRLPLIACSMACFVELLR
jgi:hypothetical protein